MTALPRLAFCVVLVFVADGARVDAALAVGSDVVPVAKTDKPPKLDGSLSDLAWQRATSFKDFTTMHPVPGKAPSQQTEVYLTYDRDNLYVGVRALDSEPGKIPVTGNTA